MRRLTLGPGDALYRGGVNARGRVMQTGAYGIPVRQIETGRTFLLSAAHVIGSLPGRTGPRTDVLLPRTAGSPFKSIVGHVTRVIPPEPHEEVELERR